MNKVLQTYLAIIATVIMLFMAAILALLIYVGVQASQEITALKSRVDDLTSQINTFNQSVKDLDSGIKSANPFN